jgi:hypothetical protein
MSGLRGWNFSTSPEQRTPVSLVWAESEKEKASRKQPGSHIFACFAGGGPAMTDWIRFPGFRLLKKNLARSMGLLTY